MASASDAASLRNISLFVSSLCVPQWFINQNTPYLHPDSFSVIISLVGQNAHRWSRVIVPTNGTKDFTKNGRAA
jgi:hypothetical protein